MRSLSRCDRVCKPGSVIDSHLSSHIVANTVKPPSRKQPGRPDVSSAVLLRIEFAAMDTSAPSGALLPHLSTLTIVKMAVYLCCTFPEVAFGGRYPLSLPCGARTFLMYGISALYPRLSDPVAELFYFISAKMSNELQYYRGTGIMLIRFMKRGIPNESSGRSVF